MIDVKYTLSENDYLQVNLYFATADGKFAKLLWKTWFTYALVMGAIALSFLNNKDYESVYVLAALLAIFSVFHKSYVKRVLLRKYGEINRNYESRFNQHVSLLISENGIDVNGVSGSNHYHLSQIDKIIEAPDYFYVKLKIEIIIIPKNELINVDVFRYNLRQFTDEHNIELKNDMQWKW